MSRRTLCRTSIVKRTLLAIAASGFVAGFAVAAEPAELSLILFDGQTPLSEAEVHVDGALQGLTNRDGAARLALPAGAHRLQVRRGDQELLALDLDLHEDENAEMIATLVAGQPARVAFESTHGSKTVVPATDEEVPAAEFGTLAGRIVSGEDGKPIAAARIYIAGTPIDLVSDADGRFTAPMAAGRYSLSVLAGTFAPQTLNDVEITVDATTEHTIELSPAGLELPEFVVLEPYVEGSLASFVEERRSSSAVADILGAEQISRAGDSDAAGALKRVTGLTLVDGKFVYVRGLGERYSSTLLNGAQVPSPDPTRRVVPLDLFPTEVLSGIVVQKTYSADMPGEFGGGTIQLRTRGAPETFLFKASASLGYADGTTGSDGLRYDGGNRDWTGFDSTRDAPAGLLDARLPSEPAALESLGEALAAQGYRVDPRSIGPDSGFALALGDRWQFGDRAWSLGYIAALRYSQHWDSRTERRRFYGLTGGDLVPIEDYTREQTERAIDASGFLSLAAEIGDRHALTANLLRVRQTTDEAQVDQGITDSGNDDRITTLEWIENELVTLQLLGEHEIPALGGLQLNWRVTDAEASRYAPNRRSYRFTLDEGLGDYVFESFNEQRYEFLQDDAREFGIDLRYPIALGGDDALTLRAGASRLERERESSIRRYRFGGRRPPGPVFDYDTLLNPDTIGPGGLVLQDRSLPTDAYTADVALDAQYLGADLVWHDWRFDFGVRREAIAQRVTTVRPFDPNATPEVGLLEATDLLPSAALTWRYSEAAQWRLGYSSTLSRPDIREQSRSNFIDPLLDIRVEGNPELKQAAIRHLDLRWEYYFSPVESLSIALFSKAFSDPIELVSSPASGSLLQIANADSASNRGIEFDLYRSFGALRAIDWLPRWLRADALDNLYFGANYAWIDSEVDLGGNQGIQTNATRPLQGQSSYVANLSLAWIDPDERFEATLLYNVSGPRISQVGVSGKPDIYEQPFHALDFTFGAALGDGWKLKAKLKNLLDPDVEFTQGGLSTASWRKGREFGLSFEWTY